MKKIKYFAFVCILGLSSLSATAAETDPVKTNPQERVEQLENRIQHIWKMDFSDMDKEQKMTLKMEVKEIKRELKQKGLDSKVSISVGAIIIILLLLILLT
ncbi:hypothetical protein SAMN05421640_1534 [Ekhidna lutea]|uniref:Seryl-tRNA synthetase n=1 Tax=Ekhidna lutea TaxID=447679 RepID=A0A239HVI2_EKHLU|nr:hypothetical protein [Ekhidna lutea]SNS85440.1 hypothetical protein SAMN05421640_1534 [Ekhidna lutea]